MSDAPTLSEFVSEFGQNEGEQALTVADEWRGWAEQLDQLIRDLPIIYRPRVHDGTDVSHVAMGAQHVDRYAIRAALYGVLADADAVAAAMSRAAGLAAEESQALAVSFAADEAAGLIGPEVTGG